MPIIAQLAWLVFYCWLAAGALTLLALLRLRPLKPTGAPAGPGRSPFVSILVPARNEERRVLAGSVRSMLAQDYGRFEVVAVNDRSTDATGLILRSLAAEDARLHVIEGGEPPEGWLGKPNALRQALAASQGEWVLATDADMIFHPAALRTAVGRALSLGLDAFTIFPDFQAHTFWERVFIPIWGWSMLVLFPLDLVNHPKVPLAAGIGGFFLMRREALERIGGFGAVRDEVLDDFRLAAALKRSGAPIRAEPAPALAWTRMYSGFRGLWESATKNWFSAVGFSPALGALTLLWTLAVGVLPPLAGLACAALVLAGVGGEPARQLLVPTLGVWAVQAAIVGVMNRRAGVPAVYGLTAPLGFALTCAVLSYSAFGVLSGRGLEWRGRRFYERGGVRPPRGGRSA
ncbi:MAG TPA: glycosyltransferase family 2 protein [Pyrinomonadaceae bacterium]|nr:glycosyltransferase family 2 protein [Pyrinomonadaceae bacterium]